MGYQSEAFKAGEGEAWLERNVEKVKSEGDPILEMIAFSGLQPERVLEIGCANGWRLLELAEEHKNISYGIDPGVKHYTKATRGDVVAHLYPGAADYLPLFSDREFDLVIYGFCLYLCDPEDYFRIAKEGDRVLADGGHIIIWDFLSPSPYKKRYHHKDGLYSHKMDFSTMWLWNPAYSLENCGVMGKEDERTSISLLKKDSKNAFPVRT